MTRPCDSCGQPYVAKRPSSRFCGERCRKRAQRTPKPVTPTPLPVEPVGGLVEATRAALEAAGRVETYLGQQALALAEQIGVPGHTGASVASLSKELRAVMVDALAGAAMAADPVDELKARRDRKLATG